MNGGSMKQMLTKLSTAVLVVSLAGCSMIPSFWDDNQSSKVIDIQQNVSEIDCANYNPSTAKNLQKSIQWFVFYSEAKGTKDVLEISKTMSETVDGLVNKGESVSPAYCKIKRNVLEMQSKMFSKAVLGRF